MLRGAGAGSATPLSLFKTPSPAIQDKLRANRVRGLFIRLVAALTSLAIMAATLYALWLYMTRTGRGLALRPGYELYTDMDTRQLFGCAIILLPEGKAQRYGAEPIDLRTWAGRWRKA